MHTTALAWFISSSVSPYKERVYLSHFILKQTLLQWETTIEKNEFMSTLLLMKKWEQDLTVESVPRSSPAWPAAVFACNRCCRSVFWRWSLDQHRERVQSSDTGPRWVTSRGRSMSASTPKPVYTPTVDAFIVFNCEDNPTISFVRTRFKMYTLTLGSNQVCCSSSSSQAVKWMEVIVSSSLSRQSFGHLT